MWKVYKKVKALGLADSIDSATRFFMGRRSHAPAGCACCARVSHEKVGCATVELA